MPQFGWVFDVLIFFITTTILFFISYWQPYQKIHGRGFKNFLNYIVLFFIFFTIAMGFSFHNTRAVLEGLLGKKSEFVRTPKFNLQGLKQNSYLTKKIPKNIFIEGFLIAYFAFGIYTAFVLSDFSMLFLHLMLLVGYSYVFVQSLFFSRN